MTFTILNPLHFENNRIFLTKSKDYIKCKKTVFVDTRKKPDRKIKVEEFSKILYRACKSRFFFNYR